MERYEQLLTCVFRRKYFRLMKFRSLVKHLSRCLHRLRWLLVADRARLVSIAHALGAFKAKDLMAAGDKHRVRFLLAAVVAVALSLRLVSVRVQQRVGRRGRSGRRRSRANETWVGKRPNVDRRIADALITINWVLVPYSLPQVNQFWANHHRSGLWRSRRVRGASWAASRRRHLYCLPELALWILQVQMLKKRTQAVLVERRQQRRGEEVLRSGQVHVAGDAGCCAWWVASAEGDVCFDLTASRLNVVGHTGDLEHRLFVARRRYDVGLRLLLDVLDCGTLRSNDKSHYKIFKWNQLHDEPIKQ